jgi:hypothetical protein
VEGYTGSMASWKELGQFQLVLNKGRDILPVTIKQMVHTLTDGIEDPKEKVRILYEVPSKEHPLYKYTVGYWRMATL